MRNEHEYLKKYARYGTGCIADIISNTNNTTSSKYICEMLKAKTRKNMTVTLYNAEQF